MTCPTGPSPSNQTSSVKLFFLGGYGWLYQIGDSIVLEYPRESDLARENAIYDILEAQLFKSPFIMPMYFRQPDAIFMPFMRGGSLSHRLQRNQEIDRNGTFLSVVRREPKDKMKQWATELASAIAYLETLGLAHGDLRLPNVLLDDQDRTKLTDFDCATLYGKPFDLFMAPWSELFPSEEEDLSAGWEEVGACADLFAFGCIVYAIDRGHVPYAFEEDKAAVRIKFQEGLFPEMSGEPIDRVIEKCWRGKYRSLGDLEEETMEVCGQNLDTRVDASLDHAFTAKRQQCREMYKLLHRRERCAKVDPPAPGTLVVPHLCIAQHDTPLND
jgi:atypical protein kinase C zeta type